MLSRSLGFELGCFELGCALRRGDVAGRPAEAERRQLGLDAVAEVLDPAAARGERTPFQPLGQIRRRSGDAAETDYFGSGVGVAAAEGRGVRVMRSAQ